MKFILRHTLKSETQYASKILANLNWFTKNGYKIKLPKDIGPDSKQNKINKAIINDFQAANKIFQKIKPEIEQILIRNQEILENFFSCFDYSIPNKVMVYFTIYGPGGSYSPPDKIIVMLKDDPEWILKMIIHEVLHIIIEKPFIKKFNILHWEKEFIVDRLF